MTRPGGRLNIYGSIASLIGVVVAVGVFWVGRLDSKKALTVQVLSTSTLIAAPLDSKFELRFDGQPVENVASILLAITNSGRQPIAATDFEKPLVFSVHGVSKIVSVKQVGAEPADLVIEATPRDTRLQIAPVLLNPRDSALIAVSGLCTMRADIGVELTQARISGIRSVEFDSQRPKSPDRSLLLSAVYAVLLGLVSSVIANAITSFLPRYRG